MKVQFKVFRSSFKTWTDLLEEASEFATSIGEQFLINITQCSDHADSLVTVWYWGK